GGAYVHALSTDGSKYLSRVLTNADGTFVIHVPTDGVSLTPTLQGWAVPPATPVATGGGASTVDLTLPKRATVEVKATDSVSNEPIPVRVQVLPSAGVVTAPASFGLHEEVNGRMWNDFAITGTTQLPVPPGAHRVVVSRGYEYELYDTPVTAEVGKTASV